MAGPETRPSPATQVPKPAAPAASDPRKASEARRPGTVAPAPAPAAARPSPAQTPPPRPAPVVERSEEEDPEKLLREYADRQKNKVLRLEQQLGEYKKVLIERDSLKSKGEALSKELIEAKKQAENVSKMDEVIKDLQGKVDAAILSNSILSDDKEKLKKALSTQTENLKKTEERAAAAEKSLAESQKNLSQQIEARKAAEERLAAVRAALDGAAEAAPTKPVEKHVSEMATRPIEQAPAPAPAAQGDPRKASEARKAGSVAPTKPVPRPALAPSGRPSLFPRK